MASITLEELKELFSDLKNQVWNTAHTEQLEDLDFYNAEFQNRLGRKPRVVKWKIPPTHRYIIDDATDHIDPIHARIVVPERKPYGKEKLDTVQREQEVGNHFWQWFWQKVNSTVRTAPAWDFTKGLLNEGLACFKVEPKYPSVPPCPEQLADETTEDYEIRHSTWELQYGSKPKVSLLSVPGTQILFDNQADELDFIIQFYEKSASQVCLDYPWVAPMISKKKKAVLWVEYWSADYYGFFADWLPVLTEDQLVNEDGFAPNPYRFVPYVVRYSGYGRRDPRGRPEFEAVGLMRFVRDSLVTEARLRTQVDWLREEYAWGKLNATHPDEETARAWARRFTREPGTISYSDDKLVVQPVVNPELPRELFREEEMIRRDIQSATFVRLVPSPRGESGAARHLALQETKVKLEPAIENLRQAVKEVCWMLVRLQAEYIGEPLTVTASPTSAKRKDLTISPSMMLRFAEVDVEIWPRSEDDKARHQQRMEQLFSQGVISRETLAEESDIQNYKEERRRRVTEDLVMNPEAQAPLIQALLMELQAAIQQDVEAQAAGEGEVVPPAMVEPPIQPEPGSLEESNAAMRQMGQSLPLPGPVSGGRTVLG